MSDVRHLEEFNENPDEPRKTICGEDFVPDPRGVPSPNEVTCRECRVQLGWSPEPNPAGRRVTH
jgi:hypothetical protein